MGAFSYVNKLLGGKYMASAIQNLVQGNSGLSNPIANTVGTDIRTAVQSAQPNGIVAPNSPGSVNIGGTSYSMDYANNPANQSAIQNLIANSKTGVQATGFGNAPVSPTTNTQPIPTQQTPSAAANIVTPAAIGTPKSVNIGGATFDWNYANDPNNQEQMRNAIVNGGNNVSVTDVNGNTYNNSTGSQTGSSATVKDNSGLIGQQFDSQLASAQAALKASIAESMVGYNKTISDAPGQYQPLRDQASAAGAANGQNLNEMLANNGQQGGVNRTETTAVNSATENNINTLNTSQQKVISDANASISDLQAKGDMQGAQLVADNANAKMAALIAESNRVEGQTYSRGQDATKNAQVDAAAAYTKSRDAQTQANTVWDQNNTTTQQSQAQANTVWNQNNTTSQQNVVNTGKNADGTTTIAGQQSAAQIAASNAATAGQLIQNKYAGQIAQGTINASTASTAYQKLVNSAYPKEEALKVAGIVSSNTGLVLDNNAKAIANKYAPQIAQGAIDGGKLTNSYQALVNAGYTSSQAADIALKYAQVGASNADANSTNVSSYATAGSFSGGTGGGAITGGVPTAYAGWINDAAKQYGVPPSILGGILKVESNFNPSAHNPSGADGMAQFLPSTAREQGVNTKDAKSSIYGAAKYLAQRVKQAGSLNGGIMGYGEGNVPYLNKVLGAAKGITVSAAKDVKAAKATSPTTAVNAPVASIRTVINATGKFSGQSIGARINYLNGLSSSYSSKPVQDKNSRYIIAYIATAKNTLMSQQKAFAAKVASKNYLSPYYTQNFGK